MAANALSFKLILSVFPLLIFVISLIGFFNISYESALVDITSRLPNGMKELLTDFCEEIMGRKRVSLLSTSLFLALLSASSGFYYLIEGIRRAFNVNNKGVIRMRADSVLLVIIFGMATTLAMYCYIFNGVLKRALLKYKLIRSIPWFLSSALPLVISIAILIVFFILINNIAVSRRLRFKRLMPGTVFTLFSWTAVSMVFKLYINNFSRYSVVYGSIGVLFVFALWINLLSFVLLFGAQINAVVCDERFMKKLLGGCYND
jgi:membrane protein